MTVSIEISMGKDTTDDEAPAREDMEAVLVEWSAECS